MKFTRRTYRAAIRRAIDIELHALQWPNHYKWRAAFEHTNRILARRKRERGW